MNDKIPIEEALFLMHYGVGHLDGGHSGRYPYGSGDDPYQHSQDFVTRYKNYKAKGLSETDIAKELNMSTTELRIQYSLATNALKSRDKANAKKYFEEGMSYTDIGKKLGVPESTVRGWMKEREEFKKQTAEATADILKREVEEKGWIDVGEGVEREMGVSRDRLKKALALLEEDGYSVQKIGIAQQTNKGQQTRLMVLTPDDVKTAEVYAHPELINSFSDYTSDDGGDTYRPKFVYPASMDSKRLYIRYPDEGGNTKDGIIQIRRGVKDLDLGESHYAQVRILVDGTHYMKGMAIYADDSEFPNDNVDVIFNTSKDRANHPGLKALKKIKYKEDGVTPADNPFKSLIKPGIVDPDDPSQKEGGQSYYIDDDGKKKLSLINKKSEEGDWSSWSDNLPSQFLSKQSKELIKKQLDISKSDKMAEYEDIMALTNPTVKASLLEDFAGACDTNSISLKAAALPRQKYQVLLPLDNLKDTEVYAPGFRDGETVALVRFPHEGTFAIPILKVNNKNPDAKKTLGQLTDAIAINSKVAERLSGADFDGDTVMVIPCNSNTSKVKVTSTSRLKDLIGFDNKFDYGYSDSEIEKGEFLLKVKDYEKKQKLSRKEIADIYHMTEKELNDKIKDAKSANVTLMRDTQKEMGVISNLITDMTLQGADEDQLARAVKHSMVVIDAEKHGLDYKRSERENRIQDLKDEFQGHYNEDGRWVHGASTLISRAKSEVRIDKRQGSPKANIEGKPWYDPDIPEGALVRKVADDNKLYFAVGTYDKKTKEATYQTVDGRTIIFNKGNKEEYDRYKPIMKRNSRGDVIFTNSLGDLYKVGKRQDIITAMEATTDARTLSTGTIQETMYADYANFLKNMANKARIEASKCVDIKVNPTAKKIYATEREQLLAKLDEAKRNAPKERMAQIKTAAEMKRIEEEETLDNSLRKKMAQQTLTKYRALLGAKGTRIQITDRQWEAIQAGAISASTLKEIMLKAEPGRIQQLATPRNKTVSLSTGKRQKINAMQASGHYTIQEIADACSVSVSTIRKYLKGDL